jgi:hypothetical protein
VTRDYILKKGQNAPVNSSNLCSGFRQHYGTSGELFLAQLLSMECMDNGTQRPDLASSPVYSRPIDIEVKTTYDPKKVDGYADQLVRFAVNYGLYESLFERPAPDISRFSTKNPSYIDELLLTEVSTQRSNLSQNPLYFATLHRTCSVADDFAFTPYATMNLTFGDCHIYPFELTFGIFMSEYARKRSIALGQSKIVLKGAISELHTYVESIASSREPVDKLRKRILHRNSWQNISTHIINAISAKNKSPLFRAREQQKTYAVLATQFSHFLDGLKAQRVKGPNGSTIHFLYYEHHSSYINDMIMQIQANSSKLEALQHERLSVVDDVLDLNDCQVRNQDWDRFVKEYSLRRNLQNGAMHALKQGTRKVGSYVVGRVPTAIYDYVGICAEKAQLYEFLSQWGLPRKPIRISGNNLFAQPELNLFDS